METKPDHIMVSFKVRRGEEKCIEPMKNALAVSLLLFPPWSKCLQIFQPNKSFKSMWKLLCVLGCEYLSFTEGWIVIRSVI